jgi:type II secretory pathway component PulK
LKRRVRRRRERGSALVLALVFLTVCGMTVGGLLTYANASAAATTGLRKARGTEYDADAAMNYAIAKLRTTGATCGTGASGMTPSGWTLNNTSVPMRVDCFQLSSTAAQRNDVLLVCPSSVSPCTDAAALLRANVIFYDTPSWGSTVGIQTWSDQ